MATASSAGAFMFLDPEPLLVDQTWFGITALVIWPRWRAGEQGARAGCPRVGRRAAGRGVVVLLVAGIIMRSTTQSLVLQQGAVVVGYLLPCPTTMLGNKFLNNIRRHIIRSILLPILAPVLPRPHPAAPRPPSSSPLVPRTSARPVAPTRVIWCRTNRLGDCDVKPRLKTHSGHRTRWPRDCQWSAQKGPGPVSLQTSVSRRDSVLGQEPVVEQVVVSIRISIPVSASAVHPLLRPARFLFLEVES